MNLAAGRLREQILVVDERPSDLQLTHSYISEQVPDAEIVAVSDIETYQTAIRQRDFDIVILPCSILDRGGINLIHELRIRDKEPAIMVVSETSDPELVASAFNSGVDYCIVKQGQWIERMGPAVRGLLRHRKLETMNETLIAKLTEANALLEEKNTRLDEFAKTVAHDIRGPLGGIAMRLEYMVDVYGDEVEQRHKQLLHTSLDSSKRLIAVVQGMYEYAKLGARSVKVEEIELGSFLEEIVSDLHFDDSIDVEIGFGDLPAIWADPNLLRKVFFNIISNAVKYCDKQKAIINIGVSGVVHRSLADFCEIYVHDNGPGIPQSEQAEIFDMFTRGHEAGKRNEGTGIGLAIVKKIVELHLGRVAVESLPGQGARFIFSLPLDKISLQAE